MSFLWMFLKGAWAKVPRPVKWAMLAILLLAAAFAYGYSVALYRTAAKGKALAQAAQATQSRAEEAAKAGEALQRRLDALQAQATSSMAEAAKAAQRASIARQSALPALQPVPSIPDADLRADLGKLQQLVATQDEENGALRHALDLKDQQLTVSMAETAQFKTAYQQETLRALALQGQLAAQAAEHERAIMGVRVKWGFGGALTGAALDELARRRH